MHKRWLSVGVLQVPLIFKYSLRCLGAVAIGIFGVADEIGVLASLVAVLVGVRLPVWPLMVVDSKMAWFS